MSSSRASVRVLRLRVKDKHAKWLCGLAREVNTVFNYCNELSVKVFERERRFLSGFDFWPFLKGATRDAATDRDGALLPRLGTRVGYRTARRPSKPKPSDSRQDRQSAQRFLA
jgi:hypothetical protein